jgi:hypothetical protein
MACSCIVLALGHTTKTQGNSFLRYEIPYNSQILKQKVQSKTGPLGKIKPPRHRAHTILTEQPRNPLEGLDEAEETEEPPS